MIVEVHVRDDESDVAPPESTDGIPIDQFGGGVAFVPVVMRRAPHRSLGHGFAPMSSRSTFHAATHPTPQQVMLPPFPTVLLPPGYTPPPAPLRGMIR